MNAELISVGTEILLGQIINTNAAWLAVRLAEMGINLYRQQTVGDNLGRLTLAVQESLQRAHIVILTGGLGPTDDDLTREGVAAALGLTLEEDADQRQWLLERFAGRMTANNLKQAFKPQGATILPNPHGTACGYALETEGRWLFMLPGPPWEMEAMFNNHVATTLKEHFDLTTHLYHRTLHFIGIGESTLETELLDILRNQQDPSMALYAKTGEIELRLTTRAVTYEEARRHMAPTEEEVLKRLSSHVYGFDDDNLFSTVASLLVEQELTLALAESCTGGLIASSFTDIPGSSAYFYGGWVSYSNAMKIRELGVAPELLQRHGAVSAACVAAMAEGARQRSGAQWALAASGVAGPGGGTPEKPVGLVYHALATPNEIRIIRNTYSQDRLRNKSRAAKQAAYLLWLTLQGLPVPENLRVEVELP
ncbi:MAG: competence/damage-inducible protein A [Symbiobacteriaceae bacterium]|nr:competence/damage-inducible protein A [Symbiobacteriaceae bacterium]